MNEKESRRFVTMWKQLPVIAVGILSLTIIPALPIAVLAGQPESLDPLVIKLESVERLSEIGEKLATKRVVYVGEAHTAYQDHLVQLALLRYLHNHRPDVAIGVEWFQARFQEHLDDYIQKRISEKEMLNRTEYYSRWRFDYRLYRPIMQFAREHGIPVIALNASTELIRAISSGGIEKLPKEMKTQLPSSYDYSNAAYEKQLREVYEMHPESSREFRWFHESQLTWDETMADNVVKYLEENPAHRMIVFAGSGHVSHRHGIPSRVHRRIDVKDATVLTLKDGEIDPGIADYLVAAEVVELPLQGRLGALLESASEGVRITAFTPGSTAKKAGMKVDDIIIAVDDQPVATFADLKYSILDKRPGDQLKIRLLRKQMIVGAKEKTFTFKLGMPELRPH
jgi:uncharacterized iron-regulated protein